MSTQVPSSQVLDQIVNKLSREDCLRILNDPRLPGDALQRALASVAGTPLTSPAMAAGPAAMAATAPKANGAPRPAPKALKAPKAATGGAATRVAPMDAIKAVVAQGVGFAAGDLATVCGLDARDSAIRTAIKNALSATLIVSAGSKRFTRYGGNAEIAQAASLKAQGK